MTNEELQELKRFAEESERIGFIEITIKPSGFISLIAEIESLRKQLDESTGSVAFWRSETDRISKRVFELASDNYVLSSSRDADIERAVSAAIMKESLLNPIPNVKERIVAEILAQLKEKNNG